MPTRSKLSPLEAARALRDHPGLARVLPSLPPQTLTRLYQTVGLADAGGLMALTPPALLARALDEAVWVELDRRTTFDPDVFVDWLEVWLGEGEEFLVERLLGLDEDMLALCMGAVVRVRDSTVDGFHRWAYDDGEVTENADRPHPDHFSGVFDRFVASAERDDEWDVVEPVLNALWTQAPDVLVRLLERLTVDDSRIDGEEIDPRARRDAAAARDQRRERDGFVPAASARAFLAQAATQSPAGIAAMQDYDLETARHLARLRAERASGAGGAASERSQAETQTEWEATPSDQAPADAGAMDIADAWALLGAADVTETAAPVGLLAGPAAELALRRRLETLGRTDPQALVRAGEELAYLSNVLIGAGLLDSEPNTGRWVAARELAFATANLGLEMLEARFGLVVTPGVPPGLVPGFLLAWQTLTGLSGQVVKALEYALAAPATVQRLATRDWLRLQAEESLDDLTSALRGDDVEAAREAVGLLSLALDADACAALTHLLGTVPRFPSRLEGGGKEAARWFRSMDDLRAVAGVFEALPRRA